MTSPTAHRSVLRDTISGGVRLLQSYGLVCAAGLGSWYYFSGKGNGGALPPQGRTPPPVSSALGILPGLPAVSSSALLANVRAGVTGWRAQDLRSDLQIVSHGFVTDGSQRVLRTISFQVRLHDLNHQGGDLVRALADCIDRRLLTPLGPEGYDVNRFLEGFLARSAQNVVLRGGQPGLQILEGLRADLRFLGLDRFITGSEMAGGRPLLGLPARDDEVLIVSNPIESDGLLPRVEGVANVQSMAAERMGEPLWYTDQLPLTASLEFQVPGTVELGKLRATLLVEIEPSQATAVRDRLVKLHRAGKIELDRNPTSEEILRVVIAPLVHDAMEQERRGRPTGTTSAEIGQALQASLTQLAGHSGSPPAFRLLVKRCSPGT